MTATICCRGRERDCVCVSVCANWGALAAVDLAHDSAKLTPAAAGCGCDNEQQSNYWNHSPNGAPHPDIHYARHSECI